MASPGETPASPEIERALAQGDRLARSGAWSAALEHWRSALDGPNAAEASRRIRWFLQETHHATGVSIPAGTPRRRAYRALLGATAATSVGTAVTMIGIGRSGIESTVVAIAAWTCFALAAVLALLFARLLGSSRGGPPTLAPGDHRITVAIKAASTMDRRSGPGIGQKGAPALCENDPGAAQPS